MQPLVSVLMITHNHAPFITRSIESVLSQQTSFGVELVIGEDASTDSTKEIIQSFSSQYPEKIFTVHHDKNIGMGRNFFDTLSRCRGKYIALLDGDDRWINDKKLQIQADFLEQNRNVVACGGNSISESNKKAKGYLVKWMKSLIPVKMEEYDREEMIISNRFRTLTVLARTDAFKLTEKEIINSPVLDWPLFISLTNNNILNKYVNLPHYFGAYNVHDGGVFSGSSFTSRLKSSLQAREAISAITHDRYLGWHFPVCSLANREHYNEELLKRHYKELFLNDPEIYLNDDVFAIMKKLFHKGENLAEFFGYIFASIYIRAGNFNAFTKEIVKLMRLISESSLINDEKRKLLRSIGTAWRDTLFYSDADLSVIWNFLNSPLKKYSGIYWYSVMLVCAGSHFKK